MQNPAMQDISLHDFIPQLRRLARGLVGDGEAADDLVRGVLLEERVKGRRGRSTPFDRVALYGRLIDHHRRERSRGMAMAPERDRDEAVRRRVRAGWAWLDRAHVPAMLALDALGPAEREVVLLVIVEGLTYAEAGEVTGLSEEAVLERLAKARGIFDEAMLVPETVTERPARRGAHLRLVT